LPAAQAEVKPVAAPVQFGTAAPARRIKGGFLKGPIPLAWLSVACSLGSKAAISVSLAIWFEAGRRKSDLVKLTSAILERFHVNRKAKYRGLALLEEAGLIAVYRQPRKNPEVTILATEGSSSAA